MKTKLVLFIILLSVIGCTSTEKKGVQPDENTIVIDINSALKNDWWNLADMVESVEIIPLETTEASLVADALYCFVTDKYIFVEDFYESNLGLTMFDRNGKFVKRFNRGNGPGEFSNLQKVMFYGGSMYCASLSKIIKYNDEGEFVDYKESDGNYTDIAKFGDGFVMTQSEQIQNQEHQFKIFKLDSNLGKVAECSLEPVPIRLNGGLSVIDGSDCLIYRFYDNNICCCCDDGFRVKYRLNFSDYEYKIPLDKYQNLYQSADSFSQAVIAIMQDIEKDKYIFGGLLMQCEDYIIFSLWTKNGTSISAYYNKNTGKTWIKDFSPGDTPFSVMGNVRPANVTNQKNTFCGIITPDYMKDCWTNNPNNLLSAKDIEILKNAKPDDNPIIVIYKLKDNL